nr:T9SS type A sorting domain-containing protein [Hymenobacter siberiensis]
MAHNYSFVDSRPLAGTSYYRLRQVDTDGTFSFSPVVAVQTEASTQVAFYPNPSANQLIMPAGVGAVQYRIFNALGQTLLSGKATDNDRLDITSLPTGPFFLELSGAAGHHTQRLMHE